MNSHSICCQLQMLSLLHYLIYSKSTNLLDSSSSRPLHADPHHICQDRFYIPDIRRSQSYTTLTHTSQCGDISGNMSWGLLHSSPKSVVSEVGNLSDWRNISSQSLETLTIIYNENKLVREILLLVQKVTSWQNRIRKTRNEVPILSITKQGYQSVL